MSGAGSGLDRLPGQTAPYSEPLVRGASPATRVPHIVQNFPGVSYPQFGQLISDPYQAEEGTSRGTRRLPLDPVQVRPFGRREVADPDPYRVAAIIPRRRRIIKSR